MESRIDPEGEADVPPRRARHDLTWLAVTWGRIFVGLAMAATSGIAFGRAWTRGDAAFWWVGGISLLLGIVVVASAFQARREEPPAHVPAKQQVVVQEQPSPLVPLLGALLVYRYQFITHEQLAKALAEQKRSRRMLGEILVGMGLVTQRQLGEALEYQQSVAESKRAARMG